MEGIATGGLGLAGFRPCLHQGKIDPLHTSMHIALIILSGLLVGALVLAWVFYRWSMEMTDAAQDIHRMWDRRYRAMNDQWIRDYADLLGRMHERESNTRDRFDYRPEGLN